MVTTKQMEKQIARLKKARAKEEYRKKVSDELFKLKHRKKIAIARGVFGALHSVGKRVEASKRSRGKGSQGFF